MNIVDIILLACFVPSIVRGISKGFVEQVVALISIFVGIWLAARFGGILGEWASPYLNVNPKAMQIISFFLIVTVALVLFYLLGRLITGVIKIVMLGWLNRLLGLVFAIFKAAIVLGVLVLIFENINALLHFVDNDVLNASGVYQWLKNFADTVFPYLRQLFEDGEWTAVGTVA